MTGSRTVGLKQLQSKSKAPGGSRMILAGSSVFIIYPVRRRTDGKSGLTRDHTETIP